MKKTYIDDNIKYTIEVAYINNKNEEKEIFFSYEDIAKTSPKDLYVMLKLYLEKIDAKIIGEHFFLVGRRKLNLSIPNSGNGAPFLNHEFKWKTIFPKNTNDYKIFSFGKVDLFDEMQLDDNKLSFEDIIETYFEQTNWEEFTDTEKIHARSFLEKYCKEKEEVNKLVLNKNKKLNNI